MDMPTAIASSQARIPPILDDESLVRKGQDSGSFSLVPTERLDLVPTFYSYSVRASLLPIRRVQHQLLTHYFNGIHPTLPVVDEYHITQLHHKFSGKEDLMEKGDFLIYYAIMVAGFAVCSESRRTFRTY